MATNGQSDQLSNEDTIVAIITPPGQGGIAALRLAGPNSLKQMSLYFQP